MRQASHYQGIIVLYVEIKGPTDNAPLNSKYKQAHIHICAQVYTCGLT